MLRTLGAVFGGAGVEKHLVEVGQAQPVGQAVTGNAQLEDPVDGVGRLHLRHRQAEHD